MHYTIFELERIEKILQAKLYAAREEYNRRLVIVRERFREKIVEDGRAVMASDIEIIGSAVGKNGEPVSGELSKAWEEFQHDNMDLMLLWGEVELFKEGINALYSYWNSAVEIFIDNMRTRTEERVKQP